MKYANAKTSAVITFAPVQLGPAFLYSNPFPPLKLHQNRKTQTKHNNMEQRILDVDTVFKPEH